MAGKTAYYLAYVFLTISVICCCIAFGTGYWYEAEPTQDGERRLFLRLGLWEACFDGYEHTTDYIGKAYYGCWWIFHKEYSYIRSWIMPPWFIAVQTFMTFALVLEFIALGLMPSAGMERDSTRNLLITCVVTFFILACTAISVTTFGVMIGVDRTWMPRFDMNRLSWSFGLAVVSGFFAAFACMSITTYAMQRRYELATRNEFGSGRPKMMPMVPKV
ncbi:hypothetical protein LSAT2_007939 [Lamellibrachia satsuma]|nr:hypothetical protein LSAT2_007939 [Lamellibrachia satsuma]